MLEKRSAWSRVCTCLAEAIEIYGQAAYSAFAPFEGLAEWPNDRNGVSKVSSPNPAVQMAQVSAPPQSARQQPIRNT
jgi:hypothetical protein